MTAKPSEPAAGNRVKTRPAVVTEESPSSSTQSRPSGPAEMPIGKAAAMPLTKRHINGAVDARIDDQVQAADLGKRAEHRAKVGALEIEAHRIAGVACGLRRGGLRLRWLRGWRGLRLRDRRANLRTGLDSGLDTRRRRLTEHRNVRGLQRRDWIVDRLIEYEREIVAIR